MDPQHMRYIKRALFLAPFLLIALVAIVTLGLPLSSSGSCSLNLQEETDPYHEPLIMGVTTKKKKTTYNFVWPTADDDDGILTVANGKKLLLACPEEASGNYQVISGNEEAYAVCKSGTLTINGTAVSKNTTSCEKSYASSNVKITDTPCGSKGNSGIIVQLGFNFELSGDNFYPLAYSCFNISLAKTFWTHHQLMGASVAGQVKCSESRSFSVGNSSLYPTIDPQDYYTQKAQNSTFNKILGDGGAAMYISSSDFLNRGHLAPHADFIFNTHRLMTYYFVNCAPQWSKFNGGNWEIAETYTRSIAEDTATTINVWTGTYGILSLANTKGKETEIYLDPDDQLLPVPLVYWKLVNDPKTKACTVIVGHNNPFLTSKPDPLCTMVEPYGWPTLTEKLSNGYTYYCAYNTFKKVVDYAPDITCNSLFEFPE